MSLAPEEFSPTGVFLNSATLGLAPQRSVTAMRMYEDSRFAGTVDAVAIDAYVERGRSYFASMLGREPSEVATGSQASQFVGLVAASLRPRSVVLAAEEDFTSVVDTEAWLGASERRDQRRHGRSAGDRHVHR